MRANELELYLAGISSALARVQTICLIVAIPLMGFLEFAVDLLEELL